VTGTRLAMSSCEFELFTSDHLSFRRAMRGVTELGHREKILQEPFSSSVPQSAKLIVKNKTKTTVHSGQFGKEHYASVSFFEETCGGKREENRGGRDFHIIEKQPDKE